MKLLLDTHVILWWLGAPESIAAGARQAIATSTHVIFISAASIWEMSIKQELGKLTLPGDPLNEVASLGFVWLPVNPEHAWRAGQLPAIHRDPFDRLLIAQADVESMVLVTRDTNIPKYGVAVLPA